MSEKLLSEKSYPTEQTQKQGDRENQPLFIRVAELMPDYAKNPSQEQRQSLGAGLDALNTNSLYESAGKSNASHRNLDALTDTKDEKVNKDLPAFMSDRLDEIKRATKGGGCFDGLPKEQYKTELLHKSGQNERR